MRRDPFAADVGILTEEEQSYIETRVVETYRAQLRARQLFNLLNIGDDGGEKLYRFYTETDPSEAMIDMHGVGASNDLPEKTANDIDLPVIHKEFFIPWRDLAASRNEGPSLLDDSIRTCTRKIAEAEDKLLITGQYTGWDALELEGFFTATGRTDNASAGVWPDNAYEDINTARGALQDSGFDDVEPVLVAPPALITSLDDLIANTGITYKQSFMSNGLLSDIIPSSNAYAADGNQDSAVLVVPGGGNFYAVEALPIMTRLFEDRMGNVHGTVREVVAPIIARPTAIAEINTITT